MNYNKLFTKFLNYFNIKNYKNISYSQEGEDLILERFFYSKNSGFYIDIGAHHPKRFSNTYLLYKKGWRGINIDPMPGIMKTFNKYRPNDINLEIGISKEKNKLNYYIFNDTALNTFSSEEATFKANYNPSEFFIKKIVTIETYQLNTILEQYLPQSTNIDLMSIDVEGLDFDVLTSNDWIKYRPKLILVEELRTDIKSLFKKSDINKYLESKSYCLIFRTYNTSFYLESSLNLCN